MTFVAVDIGGTFTDLIAFDEAQGRILHSKSLTTPKDPVQGVLDCVAKAKLDAGAIGTLIHGSTIAINTLIERKGANVGLLVTKGTRDVYIIGRGNRPEAYNLFHRPKPLAPRHRTHEIDERLYATGEVRDRLNRESVRAACAALAKDGVDAVAICFLHPYANPEHEAAAAEIARQALPGCYVTASHDILREYREYERISTTVVNAYIGPIVGGYVQDLAGRLGSAGFKGDLAIMQSNGGVMTPEAAVKRPVMMMESGPVGGIIASAEIGKALGLSNVISFDMGGTTAKAALVKDGEPETTERYYVGGYANGHPVMVPVVDVVEVGAGGGSIAWLDEFGALKVGPQSAGADPGPICYLAVIDPTITDANVALGRIGAGDFLGGEMKLDRAGAERGIEERVGKPLGMAMDEAARAIIDIAVAKMSLAVREVSVAKGYDPRDFALVASGGAGPPHAVPIARELSIPTVIIPRFPSHFSALGMLMADERHDFARTYYAEFGEADFAKLAEIHKEMVAAAKRVLTSKTQSFQLQFDLRYVGQEFALSVPVSDRALASANRKEIREAFDALHEHRYAHHSKDEPVEIINLRLVARGQRAKLEMPPLPKGGRAAPREERMVAFTTGAAVKCPVYARDDLPAGAKLTGPALISEYGSTTVIFPGDQLEVAATGELIIRVENG